MTITPSSVVSLIAVWTPKARPVSTTKGPERPFNPNRWVPQPRAAFNSARLIKG